MSYCVDGLWKFRPVDVLWANIELWHARAPAGIIIEGMHACLLLARHEKADREGRPQHQVPEREDGNETALVEREANRMHEVGGESRALGTGEFEATQTPRAPVVQHAEMNISYD